MDLPSTISSTLDYIAELPVVQYFVYFVQIYYEILTDKMVLMLISFLVGMGVMLFLELLFVYKYVRSLPVAPPPQCEPRDIQLPEVLKNRLDHSSLKQKEDCIWWNFLMQFLFSELRDSLQIRRFITKKIQVEFEEVLKSKSGVFVDELFLRDFNLGDKFPVFMAISVDQADVSNDIIQTLDLKARVVYDGGFQIAIDAALPFGRMAFVSVKVLKVRGLVRFRFTLLPFSHWSMSFYEEPEIELDVSAQLDGRPMTKLRNIIANQMRKIVRKKHTLPMYKMRFKPFFPPRPDPGRETEHHLQMDGVDICMGDLEVTVLSASRLPFVAKGSKLYCTISVDSLPWKQLVSVERSRNKMLTLELVKTSTDQSLGMMVKDEILADRFHPIVIIAEVVMGSPAYVAGVHVGDVLVGVSNNKVTSAKQAMKSFKWTKDNKIQIQIERVSNEMEDTSLDLSFVTRKVSSWHSNTPEKLPGAESSTAPDPHPHRSEPTIKDQPHSPTKAKTTKFKDGSENPVWNQNFLFSVEPAHKFLNVCVWSRGGDRSDKLEIISSSKHDVLVGYVSLNLEDIYLHCLITLNGKLQDRFKLKHGHYKTEAELIKLWSVHKGFDPNQMYGDISLAFNFNPSLLSAGQRQALTSCKMSAVQLHQQLLDRNMKTSKHTGINLHDNIPEELRKESKEGHHQFDSKTFITATFCDYCGKKIWMKDAFKCRTCNMVCHKKCLVKCLLNTICTEHGARKRSGTDSDEVWVPLADAGKVRPSLKPDDPVDKQALEDELLNDDDEPYEHINPTDGDSIQNLAQMLETVIAAADEPTTSGLQKADITPDPTAVSGRRFRILKEQTERMKDNVMKHLKRSKVQTALNDKAIMAAKDLGSRLYMDMDPTLRKDKLEELVRNLDEQLKMEMQNKEAIEKDLAQLESSDKQNPTPKTKAEIKALNNKAIKSGEKLDAMRLLMLQYCSGLQMCLNSLEAEDGAKSIQKDNQSVVKQEPAKTDTATKTKSSPLSGLVRRAGTSVKEKVTSIKKDFGKKTKSSEPKDKSQFPPGGSNNNKEVATGPVEEIELLRETDMKKSSRSQSSGQVEIRKTELDMLQQVFKASDAMTPEGGNLANASRPLVEIKVNDEDISTHNQVKDTIDYKEPRHKLKEQLSLTRSNSDSGLEICKMLSLSPEDILRYRGNSLPKILVTDNSDSDSDFFVVDSSDDEVVVSDSCSDVEGEPVAVEVKGVTKTDDQDSDSSVDQHRDTAQQLETFQV